MLFSGYSRAIEPFRTRIFNQDIKTLIMGIENEKFLIPVIELNSNQRLVCSFDELSHESKAFSYEIMHCNADWTPSSLSTSEFLSGFTRADITDFQQSINTHVLYTHYKFNLPNDDVNFKISGNYVVRIYADNKRDQPIAQACFSVCEPKVEITASVRSNTDTELNGRFQQLDFEIKLNGYPVRDAISEIIPVVRQNNRVDNEVRNLKPYTFSSGKLSYINNKSLIFEGGNEFRSFDISSIYNAGRGVSEIKFNQKYFECFLNPDKFKPKSYLSEQDVNGRFLINSQESFNDIHTEADYFLVHFNIPASGPFFDGLLFVGGDFTYNLNNPSTLIQYDNEQAAYTHSMFLKQGGYNYQYRFLTKGNTAASTERTEGSFWQTSNEYTIYVYNRGWGERYDKLIGVYSLQ